MTMIKFINLKLAELSQELHQLEKAGYTAENLQRVRDIQKLANELKVAKRIRQRQIGLRETA